MFELANPVCMQLIGRDVSGTSARQTVLEPEADRGSSLLDRVVATGELHSAVGVCVRLPTSEERIFDFVYQPLRDGEGRVNGIFVHGVDVTAQRRAEEALARRTQQAILAASVGAALTSTEPLQRQLQLSAEAIVTRLGAALARIWTLEPATEELVLQASAGLYTHLDGAHGRIRLGASTVGRIASNREPILTNDLSDDEWMDLPSAAREHIVAFAGYPLVTDRRSVGVVAIVAKHALSLDDVAVLGTIAYQLAVAIQRDRALRDVQVANEHLQESERQFRTLADVIPQLAWMADETGAVIWSNKQWQEYAGARAERAKGWGWKEFAPPDELPRIVAGVQTAVETGEPWEDCVPIRRADGVYRRFLCRARPVRNNRGQVVRWFGTATDIEEQRRAESEVRERADFEEQLIGIVSHDLRNPLQAVLLGAESLIRGGPRDERTTAALARIQNSTKRALAMVQDLLDFTAARTRGGLTIEREPMDLARLVDQIVDETRLTHPGRDIQLHRRGELRGEWDSDRIAQLITNLVTNALKYSPTETPVELHVRDEGAEVVLAVHNFGPPIPEDKLGVLFEPMQRAAEERADRSLGLGLYIVKNIVEAHGARIDVVSTAESGTTFTVRLPRSVP